MKTINLTKQDFQSLQEIMAALPKTINIIARNVAQADSPSDLKVAIIAAYQGEYEPFGSNDDIAAHDVKVVKSIIAAL